MSIHTQKHNYITRVQLNASSHAYWILVMGCLDEIDAAGTVIIASSTSPQLPRPTTQI